MEDGGQVNIDIDDRSVMCRTVGHAWEEYTDVELDAPKAGWWRLSLGCTRCTTRRHDLVNKRTGVLEGRRYIYSDGYRRQRGAPRLFREELRAELWRRRNPSRRAS